MPTVDLAFALTFVAALGCGLLAGAFYAFSSFIMRALGQLPAADGLAAMRALNVAAVTPPFMLGFIGTALACVAAMVAALPRWQDPGSALVLVGGALYLVGCFAVTAARNVPLNNALAALAPADPAAAARWADYLAAWTAWNHLRTVASLAAAAALILALVTRAAHS